MTELEDPGPKSEPRRPGRGGKLDGPTRMLNAAIEMLGRQPPSSITGRRLAKNARVHHTLIGQTYGTVASLLAAAYKRERDAFIEAELSDPLQPLRPFALADYPRFWRAHVHFLLDPFAPEIAVEMARSNPLKWAAVSMEKQFPIDQKMLHTVLLQSGGRCRSGLWCSKSRLLRVYGFQSGSGTLCDP